MKAWMRLYPFLLMITLSSLSLAASQQRLSNIKHDRGFLLGAFKPKAPDLILFEDPFCSYCIEGLKKRAQLKNYNLYIYWHPIMGDESVARVADFFRCKQPVNERLIKGVIDLESPKCQGEINQDLLMRNKQVVASFNPKTLPQYWLNGQPIKFSRLNLVKSVEKAEIIQSESELILHWERYQPFAVNEPLAERHNMAVVVPDSLYSAIKLNLIAILNTDTRYNWYFFSKTLSDKMVSMFWCHESPNACLIKPGSEKNQDLKQEFKLMTGLEHMDEVVFLLGGKILSEKEKKYMSSKAIRSYFP